MPIRLPRPAQPAAVHGSRCTRSTDTLRTRRDWVATSPSAAPRCLLRHTALPCINAIIRPRDENRATTRSSRAYCPRDVRIPKAPADPFRIRDRIDAGLRESMYPCPAVRGIRSRLLGVSSGCGPCHPDPPRTAPRPRRGRAVDLRRDCGPPDPADAANVAEYTGVSQLARELGAVAGPSSSSSSCPARWRVKDEAARGCFSVPLHTPRRIAMCGVTRPSNCYVGLAPPFAGLMPGG